jgi:hypothetical protein
LGKEEQKEAFSSHTNNLYHKSVVHQQLNLEKMLTPNLQEIEESTPESLGMKNKKEPSPTM